MHSSCEIKLNGVIIGWQLLGTGPLHWPSPQGRGPFVSSSFPPRETRFPSPNLLQLQLEAQKIPIWWEFRSSKEKAWKRPNPVERNSPVEPVDTNSVGQPNVRPNAVGIRYGNRLANVSLFDRNIQLNILLQFTLEHATVLPVSPGVLQCLGFARWARSNPICSRTPHRTNFLQTRSSVTNSPSLPNCWNSRLPNCRNQSVNIRFLLENRTFRQTFPLCPFPIPPCSFAWNTKLKMMICADSYPLTMSTN